MDASFNCFQHFVGVQNVENNISIDYRSYSLLKIEYLLNTTLSLPVFHLADGGLKLG